MRRVTWFQRIRVHEAGHAVADYLMGYHTTGIRINRRYRRTGLQGYVHNKLQGVPKLVYPRGFVFYIPRSVKRVVFKAFAGGVAEMLFYGKTRYSTGDELRVMDFLNSYIANRDVASSYFQKLYVEAARWFVKGRYMTAVAAVANALREKPNMQGREVRRIIRSTGLKPLKKWKK